MLNTMLTLMLSLLFSIDKAGVTSYTVDVAKSNLVWTATKVVGKGHSGTTNISKGSLEMDGNTLVGGSFVIDMTSINNTDLEGEWKKKLEGHLKSDDFFAVETYKTASLKITKAKSTGNGKHNVTADVTIKGKTETVTFLAEVMMNGTMATAKAIITLDRTKFDVRYGSNSFFDNLGDKAISDKFTIEVKLVAKK